MLMFANCLFAYAQMNYFNSDNSPLPNDNVNAIEFDDIGNIWIGTYGGGVVKYDGKNWEIYTITNSPLPDNGVTAIEIDQKGNIWIGTHNGLTVFDGKNWTNFNLDTLQDFQNHVISIKQDNQGNIWVGSSGGLVKFDGKNWEVFKNAFLGRGNIRTIETDSFGDLWVGTQAGVAKYLDKKWVFISDSLLKNYQIWSIKFDKQGTAWFATAKSGIIKYDGKSFEVFQEENSDLPYNGTDVLEIDDEGSIWIGMSVVGVVKYEGKNWTNLNFYNSDFPLRYVNALSFDQRHGLWAGGSDGLVKINEKYYIKRKNEIKSAEDQKRKAYEKRIKDFRQNLKEGDNTMFGMVIEIRKPIVKIQTTQYIINNYTNWIKEDNIWSSEYGQYKPKAESTSHTIPVEKWCYFKFS